MGTQSKLMTWSGRVITVLVAGMLTMSAVMKFVRPAGFDEEFAKFGYPANTLLPIAIAEVCCVLLYLFPRTAYLGAILMTGYLGGATATHVRVSDQFFGPVLVGVFAWLALYLRDARFRELAPINRPAPLG